jgi:hypothetical protein
MSNVEIPSAAGIITGHTVYPTNQHYASGIHDDAVATDLGLRGGTIAGSAHLDSFLPWAVQVFGDAWYDRGNISMYFRHATIDGEGVNVSIDPAAHRAMVHTEAGKLVGEGTIGLDSQASELRNRDLRHDPSKARILSKLGQGDWPHRTRVSIDGARLAQRCRDGLITEVHERFYGPVGAGGVMVPFSAIVDAANDAAHALLGTHLGDAVGMWGAIEVGLIDGPIEPDIEYEASLSIPSISDSPQTELLWHDVTLHHLSTGKPAAELRILSRFMKGSSTLWAT